ncbi:MAG: BlaI/MecI/CopY family transcriptional regulator [Propionibacteriaceae bacterium]|nr:BlaI/MecI/CopY family transcriptional regulator [Propionibacteriaceae bacterium]
MAYHGRVLGELETAVMEILWAHPEQGMTVRDVHERLAAKRDLAYTTVMTVLDRLSKKEIVHRELEGRAWLYRPARTRVELVIGEIRDLLGWLSPQERTEVLTQFDRN